MGPMDIRPREVRRVPEHARLRIAWSDGHASEYAYDYLRGWCPCAGCQGHGTVTLAFHPARRPVDLGRIDVVGNYALSFAWSDGHATGIYRFDFLRDLCPCPQCGGAAPAPPP